jgi:anti-anti-sigma factor
MQVTVESYGQAAILHCKGELTADTLDAFRKEVDHTLQEPQIRDLVMNLEEVPFLDSTALEYLLDLQEKLAERLGQIKLARPDENVAKVLEITRLDSAFDRYTDLSAAVKTV